MVLGLDQGGSFGLCCVSKDRATVSVHRFGDGEATVPNLVELCRAAFRHEVVPVDMSKQAQSAEAVRRPAGAALDMDSHVG